MCLSFKYYYFYTEQGAGAAGVAALCEGLLPELIGKKIVIPLCGGNIDTAVLGRIVERGLAADGRMIHFKVTVPDKPGGLSALTKILHEMGVSIKDITHERAWLSNGKTSYSLIVLYYVIISGNKYIILCL